MQTKRCANCHKLSRAVAVGNPSQETRPGFLPGALSPLRAAREAQWWRGRRLAPGDEQFPLHLRTVPGITRACILKINPTNRRCSRCNDHPRDRPTRALLCNRRKRSQRSRLPQVYLVIAPRLPPSPPFDGVPIRLVTIKKLMVCVLISATCPRLHLSKKR